MSALIGRAWRTPLGGTVAGATRRWLAGDRALAPLPWPGFRCGSVAPVLDVPAPSPHSRYLGRMALLALECAREALLQADRPTPPERLGLFAAVGGLRVRWDEMMPALAKQTDGGSAWARGMKEVHPYWMLRHLSNNAHALLAIELQALGDGVTVAGGNAGAQALASAGRALQAGVVDVAIVVAYDSLLEPETLVEMAARGAATLAEPIEAERDPEARVPGEAAAAVVLVRPADAPGRPTIAARAGADGSRGEPTAALVSRLAAGLPAEHREGVEVPSVRVAFGELGAAAAVVQAIALAELIGQRKSDGSAQREVSALGTATAAPGLASAVRVSIGPVGP